MVSQGPRGANQAERIANQSHRTRDESSEHREPARDMPRIRQDAFRSSLVDRILIGLEIVTGSDRFDGFGDFAEVRVGHLLAAAGECKFKSGFGCKAAECEIPFLHLFGIGKGLPYFFHRRMIGSF